MSKPSDLPERRPDGRPLVALPKLLWERRATPRFRPEPVPAEHLEAILACAGQAPSGFNLQPWRFVVVQEEENRRRLSRAAYGQEKVAEAPVVVVAIGTEEGWRETAREVFEEGARRGAGDPKKVDQALERMHAFVEKQDRRVWLNRHVMIAVTTMMYAAEAYGFDTAPMEGFDAEAVKREFAIPAEAEVVALLAIGVAQEPIKKHPGRLDLGRIVHAERYGEPWHAASGEGGVRAGVRGDLR